jgi:hypothetical protein
LEGKKKMSERASKSGVAATVAGEEKTNGHVLCAPLAKDLYREFLTLDNPH